MSAIDEVSDAAEPRAHADFDAAAAWRTYGPSAVAFATVLVGPDHAHDVMASAFLRVQAAASRTTIRDVRSYLLRAVANEARGHHRQVRRRLVRDRAALAPATAPGPESNADVRRAIRSLTVRQRAVVFLVYWEDLTEAAVAELLGISTGTTHRLLVTARQHLRSSLQ